MEERGWGGGGGGSQSSGRFSGMEEGGEQTRMMRADGERRRDGDAQLVGGSNTGPRWGKASKMETRDGGMGEGGKRGGSSLEQLLASCLFPRDSSGCREQSARVGATPRQILGAYDSWSR